VQIEDYFDQMYVKRHLLEFDIGVGKDLLLMKFEV
jgi:hypothetical protein